MVVGVEPGPGGRRVRVVGRQGPEALHALPDGVLPQGRPRAVPAPLRLEVREAHPGGSLRGVGGRGSCGRTHGGGAETHARQGRVGGLNRAWRGNGLHVVFRLSFQRK